MELLSDRINNCIIINDVITTTSTTTRKSKNCLMKKQKLYLYKRFKMYKTTNDAIGAELSMITTNQLITTPLIPIGEMEELHQYNKLICNECCMPFTINTNQMEYPVNYLCFTTKICMSCNGRIVLVNECPTTRNFIDIPARRQQINCSSKCHCRTMTFYHQIINKEYKLVCNCNISSNSMFSSILTLNQDLNCMCSTTINHCLLNDCNNNNNNNHNNTFKLSPAIKMSTNLQYCGVTHCRTQIQMQTQRQNQTLSSTTTSLSRPISSLLTSIASCTLSSRTKPLPLENVNAHLRMDTALCSRCYFCINATTCKHLKSYRTAAKLTERPPDDQSRMNNILYHINLGIWFFKFVLSNLLWGIITKQTIGNNHKRYRMLRKYHFIKRIYLGHHLYYYHHHHHHHHHHQTNACCFSFMYLRWSNFHINLILMGLWFFTLLSPSTNALTSLEASTNLIGPAETTLIPVKLSRTETVCKSLDIRNSADQLQQLENCTVIEGFLLLTLITTHGPNEFTRSFPLLTEVTEFILIYQINNLRSLAQIFPNLSVIRGRNLFEGYALIVHSNMHLEELGLSKLTTISRGGVRIEKNMMLCYVKTVDWSQIVSNTTDIIIEENREPIECPPCPGDQRNSPIDLVCKEHLGRRNCWNGSTCQKICPERCRHNCLNETTCCNESCLGGCSPNNTHECVICRHFSINNDTCIDKCPDNGYSYLDRRCLTAEACMELRYKYQDGKPQKLVPYDGRCTTRCPEGYNKENSTCVKCGDKCKKVCVGGLIDSVARAKEFHGCTNITGEGLSIAIKRGSRHLIEDLEYGLGSIEVISTYLKVQGTIGMLNLHFLKKLQKIEGKTLLEDRYALYVLENSDMESVWAYNQTVRIGKGTVYFHFNPKLCLAEIEKLLPMLKNQTKFDKNEVSEDSNGSRGTCNTAFLNVTTSRVQSQVAIIDILNPMQFEDNRTFIGYQYLYIQDDYGNATKHGYRPCDDGWIASLPTKETRYILYNLKPYTQYAYYVKTMTISTERRNAQSPIQHFKTRSGQPKFVRMLEAYSNSSSEIIINWQPPITANGKLIKYKIRAVYLKDIQGFETRNYCKNPLKEIAKAENPKIDHPKTEKPLSLDDCKCQATKDPFYDDENAEANIHASIEFENSLQNFVYIKKQGNTTTSTNELSNYERSKRSIEEKIFDSFLMRQTREISTDTTSLNDVNGIESNDNLNDAIYREVNASTTEFVFTNLKHFSWYLIGVEACRQPEKYPSSKNKSKKNESEKECSMEVKTQVRTLMLDDVDKVENFRAVLERTNSSRSNIVLYWNRPSTPNGAVVSYTISYELQTQDAVEEKKCITEADYTALNYQRHGYVLSGLLSGNYSIRVRANSLAGEGKYSKTIYIYIPPTTPSPSLISGIVLATLLLLALLIIVVYIVYHKKYRKEPTDVKIFPIVNPYYVSLQYVPDEWEVARDRIIQLNSLGQGSFGMVYEGILRGAENSEEDIPCAIKTVNENATERERLNFLNEASVMKQFNTYHVVHLLGVCSRGQPALVIMELMKNGDLKSYLRAHRPDERSATDLILADRPTPPSLSRIYQMAIEIADGMAYLAAKKFVHRDLAARNCMVAADLTVKIGDFGMTRDIYETDYYRKGSKGLLPVRWMPPESLRDGVYSTASDVFSYGVVLWEMTTLASQPYQGLSNDQVLRYVIEGGVMERPENCPDILYNLMQKCWHHRPTARPTFMDIIRYLENMAEPYFRKVSFYHSDEGQHTMAKEFAERCKRSGDVYDLDEEYNRYNFHIDNNSSIEGKDENLMIMETEQQHSSLGLAITPSSTPDETVKHKFALSQNIISEQILHSAPSTSSGLVKDKRYVQTKSRRHSQVRMQQADDVDAYILPDCENSNCIDLKANDVNEQGYELYDPSPNYSEVGTTGKGSSIHTGGDDFDMKSPVVGDASHLMAMRHQPITIPNIMPCSSSMSDEIINQMAASSLHPSTASAASSTASSRATTTGRFKAVADSLKPVRMRVKNMRFFNQKRSSSNASDNSNTFILKNVSGGSDDLIASGENGANGDNTTYRNDAVGSLIGQNLSTIESGGSGSAGSYSTTPRFFTTTAGSGAVGSCGGDQRNYRRLNESSTHSAQEDSRKSGEKIKSELPSAVSAFTISTNPNYQKLEESFNTSLEETTTTMASIIQIRTLRNPSENTNYQPLDVSDSANYVIYDPEQKKEQHRQQQRPDVDSSGTVQMELSDNPNYKLMGPAPICTTTTYTIPTMTTVATPPPRAIHLERSGGLHTKRDRFNKFSGTPSTSSSSEHSTEEEEDEEDYEADEGIKMDRMPLRRRNRNNPAHRKCGGSSRDHSRSRSSSSHSHVTTPINTPTSVSVSANLSNVTPSMAAYKNTIMTTPLPVPPTSTATFSLKEKWLKQQQQHQQQQQQQNQQQHQSSPPPQSQPPPNGFVGREV